MSPGDLETTQVANTVAVNVSVTVSVSPMIIRAACPRCFDAFYQMHGWIDSSMDYNYQVLKRDYRI